MVVGIGVLARNVLRRPRTGEAMLTIRAGMTVKALAEERLDHGVGVGRRPVHVVAMPHRRGERCILAGRWRQRGQWRGRRVPLPTFTPFGGGGLRKLFGGPRRACWRGQLFVGGNSFDIIGDYLLRRRIVRCLIQVEYLGWPGKNQANGFPLA